MVAISVHVKVPQDLVGKRRLKAAASDTFKIVGCVGKAPEALFDLDYAALPLRRRPVFCGRGAFLDHAPYDNGA
jgi:hypothetical protein